MTKNEYLIELAVRLQKISDISEVKPMIEYYQELIDDKIEDGMTEEDAVAEMETPDEIAARLKQEFEVETVAVHPAENEASVDGLKPVRREFAAESLERIVIEEKNSGILIKTGDRLALDYCDSEEGTYEVTNVGGTLQVRYRQKLIRLFYMPLFRKARSELVLEVPRGWNGELVAATSNGKIRLDADMREIYLKTSNGAIEIQSGVADILRTRTSNGRTNIGYARCLTAEITTSNARIDAGDMHAELDIRLSTSNGSINAENIEAPVFSAETSNAKISVRDIRAGDIRLATSNGAIHGIIPGRMEDYAITSRTSNGKNNLPDGTQGEKKLDVRTSNSRIDVEFSGK